MASVMAVIATACDLILAWKPEQQRSKIINIFKELKAIMERQSIRVGMFSSVGLGSNHTALLRAMPRVILEENQEQAALEENQEQASHTCQSKICNWLCNNWVSVVFEHCVDCFMHPHYFSPSILLFHFRLIVYLFFVFVLLLSCEFLEWTRLNSLMDSPTYRAVVFCFLQWLCWPSYMGSRKVCRKCTCIL